MKKNLRTRILMSFSIFILFVACRTELIEDQNRGNQLKQNYTVRVLNYEQLKVQAPLVADKLTQFKSKILQKQLQKNSKMYTDIENDFMVDTDVSYFVEDKLRNKTYTFKIKRISSNVNSKVVENLVLKDIGNSQYEAYISGYDEAGLLNPLSIPVSELKNHISISSIGTKTAIEIFGLYNPNPCFVTAITGVEVSYVGGTPCTDPQHHTNPNDCQCGKKPSLECTAPTQGYPTYSYTYGTVDTCGEGGGGGGGLPPIGGTTPIGGSGSSSTLANDCEKVKKPNTIAPMLPKLNKGLDSLTIDHVEYGVTIQQNFPSSPVGIYQGTAAGLGGALSIPKNPSTKYIFVGHSHNSPAKDTYSVPSWADLWWIAQCYQEHNSVDSNTVFGLMTADGTRYALMINDWVKFNTVFYVPKNGSPPEIEKSTKANEVSKEYYGEGIDIPGMPEVDPKIKMDSTNKEQDLIYFLEMIKKSNMGINVFEMDNTFTKFTRVNLNNNGTVARIPCN